MFRAIKLECFLVDVHCPTESTLRVDINASKMAKDEFISLIQELKSLLNSIDEKHKIRSRFTSSGEPRARRPRIRVNQRTRRLSFSPFPSSYGNALKNIRSFIYKTLVNENCLVIRSDDNRKTYLLPTMLAPSFIEAVDKVYREDIGGLRKAIEEFRLSEDYLKIAHFLSKRGIDPTILDTVQLEIEDHIVDIIPINFNYAVDKGSDLLRSHVERLHRKCLTGAVEDVLNRTLTLSEEFDNAGKLKNFDKKLDKLIALCKSFGMNQLAEEFLEHVREITALRRYKRLRVMQERFGTSSLREAAENFLKSKGISL